MKLEPRCSVSLHDAPTKMVLPVAPLNIAGGTFFRLNQADTRVIGAEAFMRTTFGTIADAYANDPDEGRGPELRQCLERLAGYDEPRRLVLGWRYLGVVRVFARLGGAKELDHASEVFPRGTVEGSTLAYFGEEKAARVAGEIGKLVPSTLVSDATDEVLGGVLASPEWANDRAAAAAWCERLQTLFAEAARGREGVLLWL